MLYFAKVGKESQIWGPLVEKACAKMKGTYYDSGGGFTQSGLRALVGCPVYDFKSEDNYEFPTEVWQFLKGADDLDWIMNAATSGTSDTEKNECGIAQAHAYSVISIF